MRFDYIQKIVFLGALAIILLGLAGFCDNFHVTPTNQLRGDK